MTIAKIETHYQLFPTDSLILSEVAPSPLCAKKISDQKSIIDEVWTQSHKLKKLFNGTFLNFLGVNTTDNKTLMSGFFLEYKNLFAHRMYPELNLDLKPIGVSGFLSLVDAGVEYIVVAKRAPNVFDYPNYYELVPSGSIDKECATHTFVDYKSKLLSEFNEEVGLPKECVSNIKEIAFILDSANQIYDICCRLDIRMKKESLIEALLTSEEYHSPILVPAYQLMQFVNNNEDIIVPTSNALMRFYGAEKSNCSTA